MKKKKRRAAWLSPILGGIIGGGLVLGIVPNLPGEQHKTEAVSDTKQVQSSNFTSTPLKNTSSVADMVEDLEPAIVGVSNYQASQSDQFGLDGGSSSETESGTGSGVIFKKTAKKRTLLQTTMS